MESQPQNAGLGNNLKTSLIHVDNNAFDDQISMENQPQNAGFRNNLKTFTHVTKTVVCSCGQQCL